MPPGGVCHRWLTAECTIGRRVPPVAHTLIYYRAACGIGGSHMNVPSGGVYHRWLTPDCTIERRVAPVAWISHRTVPQTTKCVVR
ncbi:hypothetical protein AVEN_181658-1 [Araneus ventricosus]|uniref:Uncharacterized protein n=1 Tax=Araneus ventricosus TaxID=182803 RepID=A0A4Y2SDQ6_ARAVE|nr:hypothetical protein AVEN_181658-1 [Araneus ventricosus]